MSSNRSVNAVVEVVAVNQEEIINARMRDLRDEIIRIVDQYMGDPNAVTDGSRCPLTFRVECQDQLLLPTTETRITKESFKQYYRREILKFISQRQLMIEENTLPKCLTDFKESRLNKAPGPQWDACVSQFWKKILTATKKAAQDVANIPKSQEGSNVAKDQPPNAAPVSPTAIPARLQLVNGNAAKINSNLNPKAASFVPSIMVRQSVPGS